MAILIPSKNIYDIDNPKIRDNIINKVSVENKVVAPDNKYETSVYNETRSDFTISTLNSNFENFGETNVIKLVGSTSFTVKFVSYTSFVSYDKTGEVQIDIKRLKNNELIEKVLYGLDENGTPRIKFSINGIKKTGTVTGKLDYDYAEKSFSMSELVYSNSNSVSEHYEIPKSESYTYSGSYNNNSITAEGEAKSTAEFIEFGNLGTVLPSISDDKITFKLQVVAGYKVVKMGTQFLVQTSSRYTAKGTYEEYIPTEIELTFYGNTIGISLTDNSVTYGDGNMPYSLNGNELLQDSATVDGVPLTKHLADNILREYKNGKETATLLCDISDYYEYAPTAQNLKGNKVISIGNHLPSESFPMTFKIQDQVVPMTFGFDGKDRPMSTKKDGTPKTFVVVGVEMIYDGAVWQKISLQEV